MHDYGLSELSTQDLQQQMPTEYLHVNLQQTDDEIEQLHLEMVLIVILHLLVSQQM